MRWQLTLKLALIAAMLVGFYSPLQYTWTQLPGDAHDIGANATGRLCVIGADKVAGGYGVYRWNGTAWEPLAGQGGMRIDVDRDGNTWIVADNGDIFRHSGGAWQKMPGNAKDVGCGADGSVYVIGGVAFPGGFKVYKWTGGDWTEVGGQGGVRIDAGADGNAWVVTDKGSIHQRIGNLWRAYPGSAKDIALGPKGEAWVVGSENSRVYQWNTGNWADMNGTADCITVSQNNKAHVVNSQLKIFRIN